jgi:hypothetical protein
MFEPRLLGVSALLFASARAACGGDDASVVGPDAGPEGCTTPIAERLSPLVMGAKWSYKITDPTVPGDPGHVKDSEIEGAPEDVGDIKAGILAWRQRTDKLNTTVVSWHEDRCTSVVRHREKTYDSMNVLVDDQFYMPSKLRVDETPAHLASGAAWVMSYTERNVDVNTHVATLISKDEMWSVVNGAEPITVMGQSMTAVHLNKKTSGNADKDYWFVKGVGKVKETGDQTEELVSYTIP